MSHCAKCKNPFIGCGNKECRCHNAARNEDAQIVSIKDYLEGR